MDGGGCLAVGVVVFVVAAVILGLVGFLWPVWVVLGMEWWTRAQREGKRQERLRLREAAANQLGERVRGERDRLRGERMGSRLALLNTMSALLEPVHYGAGVEGAVCMYLDGSSRVVDVQHWVGDEVSVPMPIDDIVARALSVGAKGIALAHNHPNDRPVPSDQDVWHAAELVGALQAAGILLVEDYVWCQNQYKSVLGTRRFKDLVAPV